jgi:hypothetical protein
MQPIAQIMKTSLYIAVAMILFAGFEKHPISTYSQPSDNDVVPFHTITINGTTRLGDSQSQVVQKLGNPNSIQTLESIAWGQITDLRYGNSKLSIIDGTLKEFDLIDGHVFLVLNPGMISVGDKASILLEMFPSSYQRMQYYEDISMNVIVINVSKTIQGVSVLMDNFIEIGVDSNHMIKYIRYQLLL